MKCFQAPRTVFPTPEGFAPQQVSNIFIMMFDISKPQNKKEIKTPTFQLSHLVASLQAAFLHRLEKFGLRGRGLKLLCLKFPNLSPGHFRYHVHNFNVPVDSDIIRLGARGLAHREQRQTCNESDGSVSYMNGTEPTRSKYSSQSSVPLQTLSATSKHIFAKSHPFTLKGRNDDLQPGAKHPRPFCKLRMFRIQRPYLGISCISRISCIRSCS